MFFMVAAHAIGCGLQGLPGLCRQMVKCSLQLRRTQFKTAQRASWQAIETLGVFQHGGITPFLYIIQDAGNGLLNGSIGGVIKLQ